VKKNCVCGVTALLVFGVLCAAEAVADEMIVAPAAFITSPASSLAWTGFYIGGNGGFGWSSSSVSYSPNDAAAQAGTCGGVGKGKCIPSADYSTVGALAGGQVGFNRQINSVWLTGVEADYQWANLTGQDVSPFHLGNVANTNMIADQSIKSFGTARVRMGALLANPFLLYGTAGLAYGQVGETLNAQSTGSGSLSSGGFSYKCIVGGSPCFSGASSGTLVGWTVGGGGEFALTSNLTFKAEILYVDLGIPKETAVAQTTLTKTSPSSFTASLSAVGFVVARGGLNFRF
jgi:outer membrane immunogenic protein